MKITAINFVSYDDIGQVSLWYSTTIPTESSIPPYDSGDFINLTKDGIENNVWYINNPPSEIINTIIIFNNSHVLCSFAYNDLPINLGLMDSLRIIVNINVEGEVDKIEKNIHFIFKTHSETSIIDTVHQDLISSKSYDAFYVEKESNDRVGYRELFKINKYTNIKSYTPTESGDLILRVDGNLSVYSKYRQYDRFPPIYFNLQMILDEIGAVYTDINEEIIKHTGISYCGHYGMFIYYMNKFQLTVDGNTDDYLVIILFGSGSNKEIRVYLAKYDSYFDGLFNNISFFNPIIYRYWNYPIFEYKNRIAGIVEITEDITSNYTLVEYTLNGEYAKIKYLTCKLCYDVNTSLRTYRLFTPSTFDLGMIVLLEDYDKKLHIRRFDKLEDELDFNQYGWYNQDFYHEEADYAYFYMEKYFKSMIKMYEGIKNSLTNNDIVKFLDSCLMIYNKESNKFRLYPYHFSKGFNKIIDTFPSTNQIQISNNIILKREYNAWKYRTAMSNNYIDIYNSINTGDIKFSRGNFIHITSNLAKFI